MKLTIRKAKSSELKKIVNITNRAFNIPFKPDETTRKHKHKEPYFDLISGFKKKEVGVFVVIVNKKIVGAIRYKFLNSKTINLFKLAVLKFFRNKGIAPKLINRVESEGIKKKCKIITLDCMKEKGLSEYYKKLGFKIDKIKKHLDHHDVFMFKKL